MIRTISQLAFLVGLVLVIILSLIPQEFFPETSTWDKVSHVGAYGALAFVGGLGFRGWSPQLLVALALLILGSGLEIAQVVVPGRTASPYDGLANLVGIVLGSLLVVGVDAQRLKRSRATG